MAGGQSGGPEERDPATVTQAVRGWPQPEASGPARGAGEAFSCGLLSAFQSQTLETRR